MTHFALITRTPRSHGSRRNRRLRIDQRVARPAIGRAHDDASRGQVVLRRRQNLPCNGSADPSAEGKKPKKQEKDFGSFEEIRANFLRNGSPTDPSAPNPLRSTPPRLHPYARTPVPSPHAPPPSARRRPSHRRRSRHRAYATYFRRAAHLPVRPSAGRDGEAPREQRRRQQAALARLELRGASRGGACSGACRMKRPRRARYVCAVGPARGGVLGRVGERAAAGVEQAQAQRRWQGAFSDACGGACA